MTEPIYIVRHDKEVTGPFKWAVIDRRSGDPALWQPHHKVGQVPMRFKTEGLAQAAADRLNAGGEPDRR